MEWSLLRRTSLIIALCLTCIISVQAQLKTITGKVTSGTDGEPIAGLNVFVKGNTARGTVTDAQGAYSLDASTADILVFSFIGLQTQEIPVGGSTVMDVKMVEAYNELGELVVTGTRNVGRTVLDSTVPVDVISIQDIMG